MNRDTDTHNPVIWLISDGKAGHRNQLRGLGNRLQALCNASLHWLDAATYRVPLWRALLGAPPTPTPDAPKPDLIVAAGTGTHRLLLSLRRSGRAKTLVVMKPAFPLSWIDGAIIPAHDAVSASKKILVTEGVINTITPLARLTGKHEALVLIGGPSPHFDWDDDSIMTQIGDLIARYPDWHWTISDSRRTPESVRHRLQELKSPGVAVVNARETHDNWLRHQLSASRAVWSTPDSMSMVCEAVTSGVPTGLLDLPPRPGSRVARGISQLVGKGLAAHWTHHPGVMSTQTLPEKQLWEADRAARWVIDRFLGGRCHSEKGRSL